MRIALRLKSKISLVLAVLLLTFSLPAALAGCSAPNPNPEIPATARPDATQAAAPTLQPTIPPTPAPPTATPEPLAARVNANVILLADFQAELVRFQQAGTNLATLQGMTDEKFVLEEMIQQTLLAEGADQAGYVLSEADTQARLDQLAAQVNLNEWLTANLYTPEQFKAALQKAARAAWMRDTIAAQVPLTAEQVHVIQILLYNSDDAITVNSYLQNGQDFISLAKKYDPNTGGELGWIARGALKDKALEDAAFGLQPGAYSPIIETQAGFHILFLLGRSPEKPLDPETLRIYQEQAVRKWLAEKTQASQIEIFIP